MIGEEFGNIPTEFVAHDTNKNHTLERFAQRFIPGLRARKSGAVSLAQTARQARRSNDLLAVAKAGLVRPAITSGTGAKVLAAHISDTTRSAAL